MSVLQVPAGIQHPACPETVMGVGTLDQTGLELD